MAKPVPQVETSRPSPFQRWLAWLGVGAMGIVAIGSGMLSANLRDHADERRQIMDQLTRLEVSATAHSMSIWRALTLLMAEDKMRFIRLRGEANMNRGAILKSLEELGALESSGAGLNQLLGFEPEPERLEALDHATHAFLASVQGGFGQMNLSVERVRKRLRHWDMNFGPFQEALAAVKERDGEIAVASARVAKRVTTAAGLSRLLASVMLVLTLKRRRSRGPAAAEPDSAEVPGAVPGASPGARLTRGRARSYSSRRGGLGLRGASRRKTSTLPAAPTMPRP